MRRATVLSTEDHRSNWVHTSLHTERLCNPITKLQAPDLRISFIPSPPHRQITQLALLHLVMIDSTVKIEIKLRDPKTAFSWAWVLFPHHAHSLISPCMHFHCDLCVWRNAMSTVLCSTLPGCHVSSCISHQAGLVSGNYKTHRKEGASFPISKPKRYPKDLGSSV